MISCAFGADRRVALRAAHDDAVVGDVDDVDVEVGIGLLVRRQRTVALDVGLRDGHREVAVAAMAVERLRTLERLAFEDALHREQRVAADLLDERDHRPAQPGDRLDQARAREQVVGATRDAVVRVVVLTRVGILRDREVAVGRIVGDLVVERGMVDRDPQLRVDRHVDPVSLVIEGSPVAERLAVLVGGSQRHGASAYGSGPGPHRPDARVILRAPTATRPGGSDMTDASGAAGVPDGVLDGVKVVELAEHGFVPSCAAVLADWGADVVKIERPGGDPLRAVMRSGLVADTGDFNFLFELYNRNKRGIVLDLRVGEGRDVFDRLIEQRRRARHELPPVGAREAARRARRRLGGQPAPRLRQGSRAGPAWPRCRPRRVRRGVASGRAAASGTSSRPHRDR